MTFRFGVFEFDSESGELRKSGRAVALEPQPSRALAVLLSRPDQLVTRDELKDALWGTDTHVDFDRGLAYCISQIRTVLGDSAESPRFIQTIPKKGYRFVAPVHRPSLDLGRDGPELVEGPAAAPVAPSAPPRRHAYVAMTAASVILAVAFMSWQSWDDPLGSSRLRRAIPPRAIVAVSIFDNETGLPEYDRLVSGLSDVVVTRLTGLAPDRVAVIGNAEVLRRPRNIRNLKAVAAGVHADYVLLGQLQQADSGLRFITHFIRLSDETHLKANRLSFPDRDLASLEDKVVAEFERAVRQHVLSAN